MKKNNNKNDEYVTISVEMNGEYGEIMEILSQNEDKYDKFDRLMEDFAIILDTIDRLDGGTRSRIADSLPDTFSLDLSGEELVGILRVLEYYDLVYLDQNTWKRKSTTR